ncbi:radical SAM protein [Agrobacterium rhizogenes]|uniref:4Fe-4S single cluster domain-containing protein n=1 Tax=Rhizobium rhizogenes TaxID=359 RepID=UPI00115E80B9|nr:4Fe-4S single cluster domain-containing protein [Rhizobium rhizogenes]NTF55021.1 radical SAM protein [Rhizobium rhizogenes]NTF74601.1 radical SAM protein [Rhizobium rhizogenes]NTF98412.1 radical SAM protein [Rhizobium rhizogenes]NTH55842.1 radical SAM protein [Rhizobium rhizogenes]NTH75462.1 radical SAM protein [Rhizobium rhizogenes]
MTSIALSRLHFPITTLGPGNRIGVWFQGCSIRCPGCISADTWAVGRDLTSVEAVIDAMDRWLPAAEGLTVSGGEPFDQPDALADLLTAFRRRSETDILVFSGYPVEKLTAHLEMMDGLVDALISDPYLVDAPQTKALRGSDNQRLHLLTALGEARFTAYERAIQSGDKKFDLMMDADGTVWMAGIPTRGDFEKLSRHLSNEQHTVLTTQDRSISRARRGTPHD